MLFRDMFVRLGRHENLNEVDRLVHEALLRLQDEHRVIIGWPQPSGPVSSSHYRFADPLMRPYVRIKLTRELSEPLHVTRRRAWNDLHTAKSPARDVFPNSDLQIDVLGRRFVIHVTNDTPAANVASRFERDLERALKRACPLPCDDWKLEIIQLPAPPQRPTVEW